jgi:hypothetical protein
MYLLNKIQGNSWKWPLQYPGFKHDQEKVCHYAAVDAWQVASHLRNGLAFHDMLALVQQRHTYEPRFGKQMVAPSYTLRDFVQAKQSMLAYRVIRTKVSIMQQQLQPDSWRGQNHNPTIRSSSIPT